MSYPELLVAALVAVSATAADARDRISIVGSSTVFPYTQAVAEQFANLTEFPSPIVESTGTGGGMQIFCKGIGEGHPDMTGASRAMTVSEWDRCAANGVDDITEALIGLDGLSLAVSRAGDFEWDLTLSQIYLALAAEVPIDGEWVENPHQQWSDIDARLPETQILVLGPPPTSGTRDAFVELAMHAGCQALDHVAEGGFDHDWVVQNCSRMRTDGPFIEAGENDNLIVQRLAANPDAMGIFGYPFLYENGDRLRGVSIAGVAPGFETIADKSYPISRPLYVYVKNAHRGPIPGFEAFVTEYVSEDALAPRGYLSERGLVPLPDDRRDRLQDKVSNGTPMQPPQ